MPNFCDLPSPMNTLIDAASFLKKRFASIQSSRLPTAQ